MLVEPPNRLVSQGGFMRSSTAHRSGRAAMVLVADAGRENVPDRASLTRRHHRYNEEALMLASRPRVAVNGPPVCHTTRWKPNEHEVNMPFTYKLARGLAWLKGALLATVLIAVACEQPLVVTGPPAQHPVSQLQVSPKSVTLLPNQTAVLMAVALTAVGDTARIAVNWSATGGSIVDTSSTGGKHYGRYQSGTAPGTYKVTAQTNPAAATDSATVNVIPVPVASVAVSPASAIVTVGQTVLLTATPQDSSGAPLSGRSVTWASGNAVVATVSATGLVTGVAGGVATITATSESRSGTASVTVATVPVASVSVSPGSASVMVGHTVQLTATLRDASGNVLTGRTVTWASSTPAIATVSASGLVTG